MARFLMVDVGAGTVDVLYYDSETGENFKCVGKSPVRRLAEAVEGSSGDLLISGVEMGGGPLSNVLRKRAEKDAVVMSASSAATVHHETERVRALGIKVVGDEEAAASRALLSA